MEREEFLVIYNQGPDVTFAVIQQLEQTVLALTAHVRELTARVQELEDRLSKDSHNSRKPPSSDGYSRKPPSSDGYSRKPQSLRGKSGKRSGGQPGHRGTTLHMVDDPDQIVMHCQAACSCCGSSLCDVSGEVVARRQVLELPDPSLVAIEHDIVCKVCPACQTKNIGDFPAEVTQPVQYGPRFKAMGVYLQAYQLLPFARTRQLMANLFGGSVSEGTLHNWLSTCHDGLADANEAIRKAVTTAKVAHFDETGLRIDKSLRWLHTVSTPTLTFYAHPLRAVWHDKRGKQALDDIGVLPSFIGTAVHDGFSTYFRYNGCRHALCNAHLLRELIFVKEQPQQPWATGMLHLLLSAKQEVAEAKARGQTQLAPDRLDDFEARYSALLNDGFRDNPQPQPSGKRGRTKQSPARNLLLRMQRHRSLVLAFANDFDVPFDNNLAERDLRMAKVRQKVSGCFRSNEGAAMFCRIRGYISTLRKQDVHVLTSLQSVFDGSHYLPALTT